MSDRDLLFELECLPNSMNDPTSLQLFTDGESGTWRLFINPGYECVDMDLKTLKEFHSSVGEAIEKAETDPESNPEWRQTNIHHRD